MVPPAHRRRRTLVEPAAPHEGAQHLLAHPRLHLADSGRLVPARGVKDDPGRAVGGGDGLACAIEDAAVKVQMRVQGGNESYPDLFQPYGGFPDGVKVKDSIVTLPELPGIGCEGKADLYPEMRALAE